MGTSRDAQLERKRSWVERSLGQPVNAVTPSPSEMGYRARIRLVPNENGQLGYHPPRSHDVVAVHQCPVARREINHALGHAPEIPNGVTSIEFRSDGQRVVVAISGPSRAHSHIRSWAQRLDDGAFAGAAIAVNGQTIRGETKVALDIAGISHRFSPETFYQVNLGINTILVDDVIQAVLKYAPAQVLDAYAGAGNFSLPLAQQGIQVVQIESHPNAVSDGESTARRLGISVDIRRQRAQDFRAGDAFFDVAIVDPPRAGAEGLMSQLLMTRPTALVMVSCNPHTLAKDVSVAKKAGYELSFLGMYDMFPQTDHVECMGILQRA